MVTKRASPEKTTTSDCHVRALNLWKDDDGNLWHEEVLWPQSKCYKDPDEVFEILQENPSYIHVHMEHYGFNQVTLEERWAQ